MTEPTQSWMFLLAEDSSTGQAEENPTSRHSFMAGRTAWGMTNILANVIAAAQAKRPASIIIIDHKPDFREIL